MLIFRSFRSSAGYASHLHNPFFTLIPPATTESSGSAWGFSLIWTGSFEATAEKFSNGYIRVRMGLNPIHTNIKVAPGESFQAPEAVGVYSSQGIGGMSRSFHDLYRNHLSRSKFTNQTRPILLNSWEGLHFDINETSLVDLAGEAEELGVELFVNDDGWFGVDYPRDNDTLGLGDWSPNPAKFPDGLQPYVSQVNGLHVLNSSKPLQFGMLKSTRYGHETTNIDQVSGSSQKWSIPTQRCTTNIQTGYYTQESTSELSPATN